MPTKLTFGPVRKTSQNPQTPKGQKKKTKKPLPLRLEHYTQTLTYSNKITEVDSFQIKCNPVLTVSPTFFSTLLPDIQECKDVKTGTFSDSAIPQLSEFLENVKVGKSMLRWLDQAGGFAPCYSFNAQYRPSSIAGQALHQSIAAHEFTVNNDTYRAIPLGVGFYLGKKDPDKSSDRDSKALFPANQEAGNVACRDIQEANLEFKFTWARCDENNAEIQEIDTFYGRYPSRVFTLNVHLKKSKNGINDVTTLQERIKDRFIAPFAEIIEQYGPQLEDVNTADKGWHAPETDKFKSRKPQTDAYKTRNITESDPHNIVKSIKLADLPSTLFDSAVSESDSDSDSDSDSEPDYKSSNRFSLLF